MNIHKNARTTPRSRAMLIHRVLVERWPVAEVAMSLGCPSAPCTNGWRATARDGTAGLQDRSSAARRHPHALPAGLDCADSAAAAKPSWWPRRSPLGCRWRAPPSVRCWRGSAWVGCAT